MNFSAVRSFAGTTVDQVLKYLRVDLSRTLKDLETGLKRLSLSDNFQTFSHTFTVASGATATIPNRLGSTALEWIVVDVQGDSRLVRHPTETWTEDAVFLKNVGAGSITATVRFFRG